jgi:hypothetical protein
MKVSLICALTFGFLWSGISDAKCFDIHCSRIHLKVISCDPAILGADGAIAVVGRAKPLSSGQVSGTVLSGQLLFEEAVSCYKSVPIPSDAEADLQGSLFFAKEVPSNCQSLLGKVVVGRTVHLCCDIPPRPNEVHPGTCHNLVRQLADVNIAVK